MYNIRVSTKCAHPPIQKVCEACHIIFDVAYEARFRRKCCSRTCGRSLSSRDITPSIRKDRKNVLSRMQKQKYPERSKASLVTYRQREAGLLKKGPCEICLTRIDVQGHHDDYSKPKEVRWLCRRHHTELHRKSIVMGTKIVEK